ncbi:MAG: tetratricopeptide repeat protein [Pseudomonadota bacterium]
MQQLKTVTLSAVIGLLGVMPLAAQANDDLATMGQFLTLMEDYFGIIESTHSIAASAEKSAILQMQKLKELYDDRGETARVIPIYRKVLENSTNQAIRSAATLLLSEALQETGRTDDAAKLLVQGLTENVQIANNQ